ncbi:MAG: UbiA family prenyltransferase [Candidatus Bathyarchaeota archaeon]
MASPSKMKSFSLLLRSRLEVIFIWTWSTIVACLIVGKGTPPLTPTFKAMASMIFVTISVYTYNDIVDAEADKNNKVKMGRPLPSGLVPLNDAKILAAVSAVIGLAIGYTINIYAFAFISVFFVVFGAYSYPLIHLKKMFLVKEIVISSGPIIASLVGSYAITQSVSYQALFAAVITAFMGMVIQPGLNDSTDIEADRLQGVKTLAMALDWKMKMQMLISGILLVMVVTPLTYSYFNYNLLLPLWMVGGGFIALRSIFPIRNAYEETGVLKARKMVIIYWALMQVFSILGALNISFL